MPKANKTPQSKPRYKNSNIWAWIVTGLCVLAFIVILTIDSAEEKRAKARPKEHRTWYDVMTPEERHKTGLDRVIEEPPQVKVDPNGAKRFKEFIENGGNADPALVAIQNGDYHDLVLNCPCGIVPAEITLWYDRSPTSCEASVSLFW